MFTLITSWKTHYNSWKNFKKNYLLIKYENLVSEPKNEFRKISNYISKLMNLKIEDKKIAITGKLSSFSRDDLKSKLEDLGVKVVNSISKNTDYVIVGSDAGSKLAKAKALNIEIISDEDLDSFLTQNEN